MLKDLRNIIESEWLKSMVISLNNLESFSESVAEFGVEEFVNVMELIALYFYNRELIEIFKN